MCKDKPQTGETIFNLLYFLEDSHPKFKKKLVLMNKGKMNNQIVNKQRIY